MNPIAAVVCLLIVPLAFLGTLTGGPVLIEAADKTNEWHSLGVLWFYALGTMLPMLAALFAAFDLGAYRD